jgi:hypothetical protein
MKSRRMGWMGYVEMNTYNILVRILEERDRLENLGVDGKIMLESVLGK